VEFELHLVRAAGGRLPQGTGTGVCDGTGRFVLDADRADEIALVTGRLARGGAAAADAAPEFMNHGRRGPGAGRPDAAGGS
jgi:hypothetical protein